MTSGVRRVRPLEILARLRRAQLDRTRQALGDASAALLAAEGACRAIWPGAAAAMPGVERACDVHVRGETIRAARGAAVRLRDEAQRRHAVVERLRERVSREHPACRQIELVLDARLDVLRQSASRLQQQRSDEMALLRAVPGGEVG